jgi:hypothetical protein
VCFKLVQKTITVALNDPLEVEKSLSVFVLTEVLVASGRHK